MLLPLNVYQPSCLGPLAASWPLVPAAAIAMDRPRLADP